MQKVTKGKKRRGIRGPPANQVRKVQLIESNTGRVRSENLYVASCGDEKSEKVKKSTGKITLKGLSRVRVRDDSLISCTNQPTFISFNLKLKPFFYFLKKG